MKSGSSASISSAGQMAVWLSTTSCHHRSRPVCIAVSAFVVSCTSTCLTCNPSIAASTVALRGMILPPRRLTLAVMMKSLSQSSTRARMESAEKPPNTTEWIAPIRAQASMAKAASGTMGI